MINLKEIKRLFLKEKIENIFLLYFIFFCFFISLIFLFLLPHADQFLELARSFIGGKMYFLENSFYNRAITDNVFFNDKYYYPLGPFPAVILIPFLLIFIFLGLPIFFIQNLVNFCLVLLIFFLIFKIAKKIGFNSKDASYWSMAFVFASAFAGIVFSSHSSFFAHVVSVSLLLLALFEYLNKKRFWLIGLLMGFVLLTRVTAFFAIIFFVGDILLSKNYSFKKKVKQIIKISIFPIFTLLLLLLYNYFRFGNFFDQGYLGQILSSDFVLDRETYGLFNFRYFFRGLYYSLLSFPMPVFSSETHLLLFPFIKINPWGMSMFFTSPYLVLLFILKSREKINYLLIFTSLLIYFVIIFSFFSGYVQFGFRYSLDFFPLLFLSLMLSYFSENKKLKSGFKILVILSTLLNIYLIIFSSKI